MSSVSVQRAKSRSAVCWRSACHGSGTLLFGRCSSHISADPEGLGRNDDDGARSYAFARIDVKRRLLLPPGLPCAPRWNFPSCSLIPVCHNLKPSRFSFKNEDFKHGHYSKESPAWFCRRWHRPRCRLPSPGGSCIQPRESPACCRPGSAQSQ